MMSASRTELSPAAFALSLGIHLAILFLVPYQQELLPPPPMRMEVQLSQLKSAEPVPAQPEVLPEEQPQPPQPERAPEKPKVEKKKPSPILTAKKSDEAPVMQETFEVPEPEAEEEPVAEPVETVAAEPSTEPPQEQVVAAAPPTAAMSSIDQPQEATESEAWDGYGQLLYDMVERNKKYPQKAIRRHLEGRVMVSARISMGKLVHVSLVDSSGHRVLDEQALEMVRKAVSVLPVRKGLDRKSFNVIVPIDFRLQG